MILLSRDILADGCFDPVHVGHVAYLRAASALGYVVVHIATDEAIRAKGRESFQTRDERARTVRALEGVFAVDLSPTLADAIRKRLPRAVVKGRDWIGKMPADVIAACEEVGAVIIFTDTQERTSTERLKVGHTPWKDIKMYRGDPGDENDAKPIIDWRQKTCLGCYVAGLSTSCTHMHRSVRLNDRR